MAGVSTLGQAINQSRRIQDQQSLYETLATQLASGKKTQQFSGLRNDILSSTRARADFKSLGIYQQNILNGTRRIEVTLNTINEIKSQADTFAGIVGGLSRSGVHQKGTEVLYDDPLTQEVESTRIGMSNASPDSDLASIQDLAGTLYDVMLNLYNAKDGDNYLLGGAEIGTKPITDNGLLDSAVTNLITQWKTGAISNTALIADLTNGDTTNNTDALSDTIVGYSAGLSSDNVGDLFIRASDNVEVNYTAKANEGPFRDIIVGLAFLKNATLTPVADTYISPNAPPNAPDVQGAPGANLDEMKENFYAVFDAVQVMIGEAIDGIQSVSFRLENASARVQGIADNHKNTQNFLLSTISDIEDVSLDEVALKISTLQTQLEATYAVTAELQNLSLTKFI